jgi:7,8-dihydropterin-6-yl-methyl-4-(beta-D-ribofuranosyl)aminobenzene 5'-phosphate synthase
LVLPVTARPIAGGFHLVIAADEAIAKVVSALKERFKVENIAPGHCTGEPTFVALKQAFGDRYVYAGLGRTISIGPGAGVRRGDSPTPDDLITYRRLAAREDPFGMRLRSQRLGAKP